MAQNVGAVMLARAIPEEGFQREILAALRQAGEKLLADSPSRSFSSGPEGRLGGGEIADRSDGLGR